MHGATHLRNGGFDRRCCGFTRRRSLSSVRGKYHECEWNFTAELVGHTNDTSVRDIGVAQQVTLQLRGGDLEAANL